MNYESVSFISFYCFNVFSFIVICIFSSQNVVNFKASFPNLISLSNILIFFFLFPYHANLSRLLDRFPFFMSIAEPCLSLFLFPVLSPFLLFISIAKNGVSSSSISPFSFQLFLHNSVSVVYRIWCLISKRGRDLRKVGYYDPIKNQTYWNIPIILNFLEQCTQPRGTFMKLRPNQYRLFTYPFPQNYSQDGFDLHINVLPCELRCRCTENYAHISNGSSKGVGWIW